MDVHEHVPHFAVNKTEHRAPPSFSYKVRELLHRQEYREKAGDPDPRFRITLSKLGAYTFLDRLRVRHAKVRAVVPLGQLSEHLGEACVVKPLEGRSAIGVAVLDHDGDGWIDVMRDVRHDAESLHGWLTDELARLGTADRWIVEERLVPPAGHPVPVVDDLKVYTFGGEVGLLLVRRGHLGKVAYRWFGPDLQPVETGKYEKKRDDTLSLPEATDDALEIARTVSAAAPFAFIRVDTHPTAQGVFVGELNSHVGAYDGFDDAWDHRLGVMWERAEARVCPRVRTIPARIVEGRYPASWRLRWWLRDSPW
jgi:hypothetical protein